MRNSIKLLISDGLKGRSQWGASLDTRTVQKTQGTLAERVGLHWMVRLWRGAACPTGPLNVISRKINGCNQTPKSCLCLLCYWVRTGEKTFASTFAIVQRPGGLAVAVATKRQWWSSKARLILDLISGRGQVIHWCALCWKVDHI